MVTKQDLDGSQELNTEGKKPDLKHNHILCGIKNKRKQSLLLKDANDVWRWTPEDMKGILGSV